MKSLDVICNEIISRDLLILKDVLVAFHDELAYWLVLAFACIRTAPGSEEENRFSIFAVDGKDIRMVLGSIDSYLHDFEDEIPIVDLGIF